MLSRLVFERPFGQFVQRPNQSLTAFRVALPSRPNQSSPATGQHVPTRSPRRQASSTFSATPSRRLIRSPMIPVSSSWRHSFEYLRDSSVAFGGVRNVKLPLHFPIRLPGGFLFRSHLGWVQFPEIGGSTPSISSGVSGLSSSYFVWPFNPSSTRTGVPSGQSGGTATSTRPFFTTLRIAFILHLPISRSCTAHCISREAIRRRTRDAYSRRSAVGRKRGGFRASSLARRRRPVAAASARSTPGRRTISPPAGRTRIPPAR